MDAQYCPICNKEVTPNPRYPNYRCGECADKAADIEGRKLEFYNASLLGTGYVARYADTLEPYESNICYIDQLKCWADEARFGGIVIQKFAE